MGGRIKIKDWNKFGKIGKNKFGTGTSGGIKGRLMPSNGSLAKRNVFLYLVKKPI